MRVLICPYRYRDERRDITFSMHDERGTNEMLTRVLNFGGATERLPNGANSRSFVQEHLAKVYSGGILFTLYCMGACLEDHCNVAWDHTVIIFGADRTISLMLATDTDRK